MFEFFERILVARVVVRMWTDVSSFEASLSMEVAVALVFESV